MCGVYDVYVLAWCQVPFIGDITIAKYTKVDEQIKAWPQNMTMLQN